MIMNGAEQEHFLLSVIIPVYNCEAYLTQAVGSVMSQTYRNLEILLVNDGSTDSSGELCDYIAKQDNRIRVVHQKNQGVSAARNNALKICKGEYIHFQDSDDWIEKEAYSKIIRAMVAEDCDVACFGWYTSTLSRQKEMAQNAFRGTGDKIKLLREMLLPVGNMGNFSSYGNYVWNKLFKRSAIFTGDQICLFDESRQVAEDGIWLMEAAQNWEKGCFLPEPFYHYRVNFQSIMNNNAKYFLTRAASQEAHLEMLKMAKTYDDSVYEVHKETCIQFFWRLAMVGAQKKQYDFVKNTLTNMFIVNEQECPAVFVDQIKDLVWLKSENQTKEIQFAKKIRKIKWRIKQKLRQLRHLVKQILCNIKQSVKKVLRPIKEQ